MNAPAHEPDQPAIDIAGLRKSFGDKVVLDSIDLTVSKGTVFALLGPNGSGKTTMIQILATLLRPDGGEASVGGHDILRDSDGVRHTIGMTGQLVAIDNLLTGRENLRLMSDLCHLERRTGQQRIGDLLEQFDLVDAADKPPSAYSGGMRRRLDLAMTLVGEPRIIFLDEPTTGLDPRSRRTMWQIIRDLVHDGVTIFLTTQYLDEADHLADRIAVLDRGVLVAQGTPAELKRLVPGGHILLRVAGMPELARAASAVSEGVTDHDALTLQVPSDGGITSLRDLLRRLDDAAVDIEDLSIHTPDLDDVFFALTSRIDTTPHTTTPHTTTPHTTTPHTTTSPKAVPQ